MAKDINTNHIVSFYCVSYSQWFVRQSAFSDKHIVFFYT